MTRYMLVEEDDDGDFLGDPEFFDSQEEAEQARADKTVHGQDRWAVYRCQPL